MSVEVSATTNTVTVDATTNTVTIQARGPKGDTGSAGGAPDWSDIGGPTSGSATLQAELILKQAVLVSGTNIKTINSTTILGSGDLAVATAAQGALADSALQSGDNISLLTNDAGYLVSVNWDDIGGTQSDVNVSGFTNDAGYLISYTETDTLSDVTGRGASTTDSVTSTVTGSSENITLAGTGSGTALEITRGGSGDHIDAGSGDFVVDSSGNVEAPDYTITGITNSVKTQLETKVFSFVLDSPTALDSIPLGVMSLLGATILAVEAFTDAGTATFQLEERAAATPTVAGTDIMTSELVAATTPASATVFDNDGIAAENKLQLEISAVTGSPTKLNVFIKYKTV